MNIVLFRTFLELVNMRNFNKAADRLCVTQSTVTMRIATLENHLGHRLFTRNKAGVELTMAGKKFQPYAELVIQTWQHACHDLALPSNLSTLFKLGCDPALWERLAGPWLTGLQKTLPEVALGIDVSESGLILQRLAQGLLDAALLYEPRPRQGVKIIRLVDDHLVLVSTERRKAVRWHPAYVYVQWGEDFHGQHLTIMPNEITPPVTFKSGRWALDFILDRGGSAYFPLRMVSDLVAAGKLFVVDDASVMTRSVHVAYRQTIAEEAWFKATMQALQEHAHALETLTLSFLRQHVDYQSLAQRRGAGGVTARDIAAIAPAAADGLIDEPAQPAPQSQASGRSDGRKRMSGSSGRSVRPRRTVRPLRAESP